MGGPEPRRAFAQQKHREASLGPPHRDQDLASACLTRAKRACQVRLGPHSEFWEGISRGLNGHLYNKYPLKEEVEQINKVPPYTYTP